MLLLEIKVVGLGVLFWPRVGFWWLTTEAQVLCAGWLTLSTAWEVAMSTLWFLFSAAGGVIWPILRP